MTTRTPTRETPFKIAFGTEAVIPMEVSLSSLEREPFNEKTIDVSRKLNLDCLDEVRKDSLQRMTKYKQKMTKYHDQKVKPRRFNLRDLVLCRVTKAT